MTPDQHVVHLPHPHRDGPPVTAVCACGGWSTTYGWGVHGAAREGAAAHVQAAAGVEAEVARQMSGQVVVFEGASL